MQQNETITIYHSPDADDAFMFYGLASGAVRHAQFNFRHELCDIETLNQRTRAGELDVTAVSVHALTHLNNQYVVLRSGASMGGTNYGPRLVSKNSIDIHDGERRKIAVPGELTSATLALKLFLKESEIDGELINYSFDEVENAVKQGEVSLGVIIHEGQLTIEQEGLTKIVDLGEWWWKTRKLSLPLGVNVVRSSLGSKAIAAVAEVLRGSIEFSLANREKALDYALQFGRGISREQADQFVAMYVNDVTVDFGSNGAESIIEFLKQGASAGFCPASEINFAPTVLKSYGHL